MSKSQAGRFSGRHAFLHVFVCEEIDVGAEFVVEVSVLAVSIEERCGPAEKCAEEIHGDGPCPAENRGQARNRAMVAATRSQFSISSSIFFLPMRLSE